VSSGDFVGSLPVGMQSRGVTDLPYWSSQNMYVYKEVWVHSTGRWIWMMQDLLGAMPTAARAEFRVASTAAANGDVTVRLTTVPGARVRSVVLRAENLTVDRPTRTIAESGAPVTIEWKGRVKSPSTPWVAVVVPDGDITRRQEVAAASSLTHP
jgi:hypothetical protein